MSDHFVSIGGHWVPSDELCREFDRLHVLLKLHDLSAIFWAAKYVKNKPSPMPYIMIECGEVYTRTDFKTLNDLKAAVQMLLDERLAA